MTTTALHHVRIGHTTFLAEPLPMPMVACCGDNGACEFHAIGSHLRGDAISHAQRSAHVVLVGEGRTVTVIEVTS